MKFTNNTWTPIGNGVGSIAIDKNGLLYGSYLDSARLGILKYNGSNFENMCMYPIHHPVLGPIAVDTGGVPYVTYLIPDSGEKAAMVKFDQGGCDNVGGHIFSPGEAQNVSMDIDINGIPYVAFEDGTTPYNGVTVMRFGTPPATIPPTPTFAEHLFPNPAASQLTISWPVTINTIEMYNILGQVIYTNQCSTQQITVNVGSIASGVYFIKVNGKEVRKFVKD